MRRAECGVIPHSAFRIPRCALNLAIPTPGRVVYNRASRPRRLQGGSAVANPFFVVKWLVRARIARWLPSVRRRLEGGAAYLRYLSDRCLATPLDGLTDLAAFWQADAPDAIDLALSAPHLDGPPAAVRAAAGRGYPPAGG
jgi:hypothetical protein